MATAEHVYFLGAGASVPDGYRVTAWLSCAVAAFLRHYRDVRGQRSPLEAYLASVYGLKRAEMEASADLWADYADDEQAAGRLSQSVMPDIIDLLSALDLAIVENASFGPTVDKGKRWELRGNELVRVRERAVEALVTGFSQVRSNRLGKKGGHETAEKLVSRLHADDVVVTTNWDILIEEALCAQRGSVAIDYGANLINVTTCGVPRSVAPAGPQVLKLHGSFNWLHCPHCRNLYANPNLMIAPEPVRRWPIDKECDCGAELVGVLITPTYLKTYQIPQLLEIWRKAQKALEFSPQWIFIGYSLPNDDLWIRGMLMRAFAIRRHSGALPEITVVSRGPNKDLEQRYKRLFRGANFRFFDQGVEKFVENEEVFFADERATQSRRQVP
ncbi:hypothetical protein Rleg9DRAFT_0506 [Rhizobium leguminosarum bv. trifolii WSM597]|uniref:Uncharacterized protein n=1 Tax=Rhizobium leguminosarum bv. trifolii WSM597 TaxID=754764 RepID=I9N4Z0_RHILT|nr:SIR2 family protein [Rhizobium leguminosarum]EJB01762.1 hypothetical protein Rleg9DRAFT_0506 [Rhizobium leguminosarum bv. trifolii WSM597]